MFDAKILADSRAPIGARLVTMELTYPRCIHSEFMTHRMFSRNAASSRAIPVEKMLARIQEDPFIPLVWGTNQPGMVAGAEHEDPEHCKHVWLRGRDLALDTAWELEANGLHKQIINRIVEPWMWITVIASGVDHAWENFFKLRCAPDAEPHIQKIAYMARDLFDAHEPDYLDEDDWHLPLIGFPGDYDETRETRVKLSVARCARVAYLTHDGKRDVAADLKLYDRLREGGHWSPFEHAARVVDRGVPGCSNIGPHWSSHREDFQDEYCTKAPR